MPRNGKNVTSGKSSGAASTRPIGRTEGYKAVKAGFSQGKRKSRGTK